MYAFWRNPYINTPLYTLLTMLIDEFILRRNPHWALIVTIYALCSIPFSAIFLWSKDIVVFGVVKILSVTIPTLIIVLFRLANVSVNTKVKHKSKDVNNDDDEACTDVCVATETNIRLFEMKRVYYHCLMSNKLINFLRKRLLNNKMTHGFNIFCYIMLCINIFEAVLFEGIGGKSSDGKHDWSRIFNCLSGILLIITMPTPFNKSITKKCYYFNTQSRYTDYIIDFGGTGGSGTGSESGTEIDRASHWLLQIAWVTIYSSWDWEFFTRYFGYVSFWSQVVHVWAPLLRCYFYKENINGINKIGGIYFQSRAHSIMLYGTIIQPVRGYVIGSNWTNDKWLANGLGLMIWSIVNFVLAIVYAYWWFVVKKKQLKQNKDENGCVNELTQTTAGSQSSEI